MSATSLLSLVCSMAFFQAVASEPSGKISLRDSLGPTIIPVAETQGEALVNNGDPAGIGTVLGTHRFACASWVDESRWQQRL